MPRTNTRTRLAKPSSPVADPGRFNFSTVRTDTYTMSLTTDPSPSLAPMGQADTAPTIEISRVSRSFGPNTALLDLSVRVPAQRITVLLGPNGAGKTTAIRMITGALSPDAGTVRVFGLDPSVDGEEVRRRCGVVSAKPSLYDRLSGWDNLPYSAELYGLGRGES